MKVSVIGAGQVGATVALRIAEGDLADVVLLDVLEGIPIGKALDMYEAAPVAGHSRRVVGTNDYVDTAGSDIVVITAGIARKPGMSRDDLQKVNAEIVDQVVEKSVAVSPDAFLLMVTNPLDVMTELAYRRSGLDSGHVFGMAGVLDSSRFRCFVAAELDVAMEDVQATVLGGHGDDMVPLPRFCTVSGIPITELLPPETIERIVERTRKAGGEIVQYLKAGSAYYAPSAAVFQMTEAIVKDKKRVLSACVRAQGQYGLSDQYVGLPAKFGRAGVEEIIELRLSEEELAALHQSAAHVREQVALL